jgi:hypothetical protein
MSDQEYWAFVMASTEQFSTEQPVPTMRPLSQFWEGANQLCLVYPATASLVTAPECGSHPTHLVYQFEQEQGVWKIATFESPRFERILYWFLERNACPKAATPQK